MSDQTVTEKRTGLAITSLVLSVIGIFTMGGAAFLGVIFGHLAKGKIKQEPELYGGHGMATAGLILGYIVVFVWAVVISILGGIVLGR